MPHLSDFKKDDLIDFANRMRILGDIKALRRDDLGPDEAQTIFDSLCERIRARNPDWHPSNEERRNLLAQLRVS